MSDVRYRDITVNDFESIKCLIKEAFEFEKFISDDELLKNVLDTFLIESILDSSFIKVAEQDNKFLGFIFAKSKNDTNSYEKFFMNSKTINSYFENLKPSLQYELIEFMKIKGAYDELIIGNEDRFQGAINLFIVDKNSRGLGVGKKLLNMTKEYMIEQKVKSIYLFTDTRCNYEFYNRQGFALEKENDIFIKSINENLRTFLYSYNF